MQEAEHANKFLGVSPFCSHSKYAYNHTINFLGFELFHDILAYFQNENSFKFMNITSFFFGKF